MPGSSVSACHMCHLHNHHPEGLVRTNPLRSSRNRVKSTHQKYTGNRPYPPQNGYASAQEDGYVRRTYSNNGMGRLNEHSHSMGTRSRSNSLSGYQGEISILPDGRVSNPYGLAHGTSTRSLDINPAMPVYLEPRNSSLPRVSTSHHHSHIIPQPDLLVHAPPPRSIANSRSGTLTRTPAASVTGQDNSHDYYLHLHRQRFKEEKRKHRFNLQTVMLIGCYTILVMIAIVVGVVVCYQNGWLGLGTQEKIQGDSVATGGNFHRSPDSALPTRDRSKISNQSTNKQNEVRTRVRNDNNNLGQNPGLGSNSDNRFSANSNVDNTNNKHLNSVNFAGFFPSNPGPTSGSARDIFTNINHPSQISQGVSLQNSGLQNDRRNQRVTLNSQSEPSVLHTNSRNSQTNLNSQGFQTQQTEQRSTNNPTLTQRVKARTNGASNHNDINTGLTYHQHNSQVLQNEQPRTQNKNFGQPNVRVGSNSDFPGATQISSLRLPSESRSPLRVVDGVLPVDSFRRFTAAPLDHITRNTVAQNINSDVVHSSLPRTNSGVTSESHIPVVSNLLNPIDANKLKDTESLTTQELLDLLAVRRMKDLLNSGGDEKSILEVLRNASPSGDMRLETIKEEKLAPMNDMAFRQRNREARLLDANNPSVPLNANKPNAKVSPSLPRESGQKVGLGKAKDVKSASSEPDVDPFHNLNSNTSFSVISSLINNTVNGAILRLLNSRNNFDNIQVDYLEESPIANSNQRFPTDNQDLGFLIDADIREKQNTAAQNRKPPIQNNLNLRVAQNNGQNQQIIQGVTSNRRDPTINSDISFTVGSDNVPLNDASSQNVDNANTEESLRNLLILQKLVTLNNERQKTSTQILANQTPKTQSKISQSQEFSGILPLSEFTQSNSVSRLGFPLPASINSNGKNSNAEDLRGRQVSQVSNFSRINSGTQTQDRPIQKTKGPDPSFAVLVKTDGQSSGQKSPKSLFPPSSRTKVENGEVIQSEPVKEQVVVHPGNIAQDSAIIRAWTHMDKTGTLSHGQVHSDGSFSFTNCKPVEVCHQHG